MLCLLLSSPLPPLPPVLFSSTNIRRRSAVTVAVFSSHSNPKILKSRRKSPYGRRSARYNGDDDDEDFEDDDDEEEDGVDEEDGKEQDSDDNFPDIANHDSQSSKGKNLKSCLKKNSKLGSLRAVRSRLESAVTEASQNSKEVKDVKFTESRFQRLTEELDFDQKWFPLIDYLSTFGLKESHFISIYERHMPCLQINLASAQERLEYLISVGVKHRDVKKIIMRQPQILEYTVDNNLKSHVAFLVSIGVPDSRIGQVIAAAPSLFSYSVERSLKPTVRYLVEEVGIKASDVSKVVQLSPQILVQRIDNSWTSRFNFLSKELGAPRDNIVKMVTKHPQLLHYSIEDGILPRINFLRSIGMRNSEIVKVITSLTQVLSLSLEGNLKPKYLYLVNELGNKVHSLTKYPMYFSLSLDQRIRPRHRFLVSLKKAPKGPFPLSSLVPTDESFCQQWAGTSLDKYLAFRQSLLLNDFAKKYERRR